MGECAPIPEIKLHESRTAGAGIKKRFGGPYLADMGMNAGKV